MTEVILIGFYNFRSRWYLNTIAPAISSLAFLRLLMSRMVLLLGGLYLDHLVTNSIRVEGWNRSQLLHEVLLLVRRILLRRRDTAKVKLYLRVYRDRVESRHALVASLIWRQKRVHPIVVSAFATSHLVGRVWMMRVHPMMPLVVLTKDAITCWVGTREVFCWVLPHHVRLLVIACTAAMTRVKILLLSKARGNVVREAVIKSLLPKEWRCWILVLHL